MSVQPQLELAGLEHFDPQKRATVKRSTLYLSYCNKIAFPLSQTTRGCNKGLPTFPRPPRFNRFRVFSKLLPPPRGWTPEVTSGDPTTSLLRGRGPQQGSPPQAREDCAPCGAWRGGASRRALPGRGGARPPRLRHHWPQTPDWRAHVTGRARPLGNVFSLLHS